MSELDDFVELRTSVGKVAVIHGPEIKPDYGYRIDYRGRSVLISGDTRFSENLIRNGKGVDLLVHYASKAAAPPPLMMSNPRTSSDAA